MASRPPRPLRILISGAGCAGPALALCLAGAGHRVTVVERSASLRNSGAQLDLRPQALAVLEHMGLLDVVKAKIIHEPGVAFVDCRGTVKGTVLADPSLPLENGIMRGDLVRILYDSTREQVDYIFGTTIDSFEQDDHRVVVFFSNGFSDTFDLLVGAEGQNSFIRKAILPPYSPDPYFRLGVHMAYCLVPHMPSDTTMRQAYHAPGGRLVMCRAHDPTQTQVTFNLVDSSSDMVDMYKTPLCKQKEFWAARFRGAGWQTDRLLDGMLGADDVYFHEVVQVRSNTWYKGRVVLIGDAAYCPSPFSGMATTACLVGAYVLAGEISQSSANLPQALKNYETTLRPFVKETQKVSPRLIRWTIPQTRWGIGMLHFILRTLCWLRLPGLTTRVSLEDKCRWKLPDYPGLLTPPQHLYTG
ncbi:hypothetical protein S40293_04141 [Stachybotrys chartarum IBT 40293]|nr:hypothetical protein S40293_04141 [Stachybotrys chartarum IBT 40293]